MNHTDKHEKMTAINNPETSSEDVLRLADELFSEPHAMYVDTKRPFADKMVHNVLHALIKHALEQK